MEIVKVFSDIEGDERLYSVLMNEDELTIFSEIQKEFNSKAQKALRKIYDYQKGAALERLEREGNPRLIKNIFDSTRALGRKANIASQTFGKQVNPINSSINAKSRLLTATTGKGRKINEDYLRQSKDIMSSFKKN